MVDAGAGLLRGVAVADVRDLAERLLGVLDAGGLDVAGGGLLLGQTSELVGADLASSSDGLLERLDALVGGVVDGVDGGLAAQLGLLGLAGRVLDGEREGVGVGLGFVDTLHLQRGDETLGVGDVGVVAGEIAPGAVGGGGLGRLEQGGDGGENLGQSLHVFTPFIR